MRPHVQFWNNLDISKIEALNPLSPSSNLNFLMDLCTSANGISIHSVASARTLKVILDVCPLFSTSNWSLDLLVPLEKYPLAEVLFYHPQGLIIFVWSICTAVCLTSLISAFLPSSPFFTQTPEWSSWKQFSSGYIPSQRPQLESSCSQDEL